MAPEPDRSPDAAPAAAARAEATARITPGAITLARHGEPALSRRIRLNADGYRRWWATYEEGGLLPDQTPPAGLVAAAARAVSVYASERCRAVETAQAAVGDRPFTRDMVFIEAPLPPPPLPGFVRLKPRTWGLIARTAWWFFGHDEGQETRSQAEGRVARAADLLETAAQAGDVLLLAHGFFNTMLARELRRRRWRMVEHEGYGYWGLRRFERRR